MLTEFRSKTGELRALFSIKPGSISVTLNEAEVYSFDEEGKLFTAWLDHQTYIRTLDNRIVKKWHEPGRRTAWKLIAELPVEESRTLIRRIWTRIHELDEQLQRGQMSLVRAEAAASRPAEEVLRWLKRIVGWDNRRLEGERERFFSVYKPVTILPPDQYRALVLQPTEGCHWNRCTFCHFYRHGHFHIKSDDELVEHIRAVKEFFGAGIRLRRSIFLGDANALVIPQEKLLTVFDRVIRDFSFRRRDSKPADDADHFFEGIYSFIDAFTADKKTESEFRELRARNLRRVYVGVETGCDELLKFLNKPGTARNTLENILTLKQAGLNVGVIILIGVGGKNYARPHVEQTVQLLNQLNLEQGDFIYFSPLVESLTSEYARRCADAGIRPLTEQEQVKQIEAIRSALRFAGDQRPKISLYDIREFIY